MQTVGSIPLCWHSRTEHGFSGNKFGEAKPVPTVAFLLLPFFGETKKTRSPKENEFLRSKNEIFV